MEASARYRLQFMVSHTGSLGVIAPDEALILSHFLMMWYNPKTIVEYLLPEIDKSMFYGTEEYAKVVDGYTAYFLPNSREYLNGVGADVAGFATINRKTTVLSHSDLGHENMELPSSDFKRIVIEWLAFILNNSINLPPPLIET